MSAKKHRDLSDTIPCRSWRRIQEKDGSVKFVDGHGNVANSLEEALDVKFSIVKSEKEKNGR